MQMKQIQIQDDEDKNLGSQTGNEARNGASALSATHTPGPWRVEAGTFLVWGECTETSNGIPVVMCDTRTRHWGRRISEEEHEANARLTAAAPSLYDSLTKARDTFSDTIKLMRLLGRHTTANALQIAQDAASESLALVDKPEEKQNAEG